MQYATKPPVHFWIVGIVSLLWNAIGAFDYLATEMKLEFYMSQFTPQQLDYFYGFPVWIVAAWALGVWGALLGYRNATVLLCPGDGEARDSWMTRRRNGEYLDAEVSSPGTDGKRLAIQFHYTQCE